MMHEDTGRRRWILLLLLVSWGMAIAALPFAPARIPTHWGFDGQPNGFMAPLPGLLLLPVTTTLIAALLQFLPQIGPHGQQSRAFASTDTCLQVRITVLFTALEIVTISVMLGWVGNTALAVHILVGLLLIGIGDVLGKLRPNWFAGIRTPWTLRSPDVWTRTHRLGGRLLVLVGFIVVIASLVLPPRAVSVLLPGGLAGWAVVLCLYSYWIWRQLLPGMVEDRGD